MCGLNRFSSESSQQTWQEDSPLPQPENAKNLTGKTAVWNTPAVCSTAASSEAAHHGRSGPPELLGSEQSPACEPGLQSHRPATVNQEAPEDSEKIHSAKKYGSGRPK